MPGEISGRMIATITGTAGTVFGFLLSYFTLVTGAEVLRVQQQANASAISRNADHIHELESLLRTHSESRQLHNPCAGIRLAEEGVNHPR